jgi:hypothetical protein
MRTKGAKLAGVKSPGVGRGNVSGQGERPRGSVEGGSDSTNSGNSTDYSTDSGNSTDYSTDSGNSTDNSTYSGNSTDNSTNSGNSTDNSTNSGYSTDNSTDSSGSMSISDDRTLEKVEIEVEKEVEEEIEKEEGPECDMSVCLHIAQSCLYEVYGVRSNSNVTVQVATVHGERLWG